MGKYMIDTSLEQDMKHIYNESNTLGHASLETINETIKLTYHYSHMLLTMNWCSMSTRLAPMQTYVYLLRRQTDCAISCEHHDQAINTHTYRLGMRTCTLEQVSLELMYQNMGNHSLHSFALDPRCFVDSQRKSRKQIPECVFPRVHFSVGKYRCLQNNYTCLFLCFSLCALDTPMTLKPGIAKTRLRPNRWPMLQAPESTIVLFVADPGMTRREILYIYIYMYILYYNICIYVYML